MAANSYTSYARTFVLDLKLIMLADFSGIGRRLGLHKRKKGLAPGTLVYGGSVPTGPVRIRVIEYDIDHFNERDVETIEELADYATKDTVAWIDIDGVHDTGLISRLGTEFGIHPLTLEDIVSTKQRPKLEEYPSYVYVVLQMMHYDSETATLQDEQVSLVFGHGFLISFQESIEGDVFEPVRKRLREHRGRLRSAGADFLAYSLIDIVVDHYMVILESIGEHIEQIEDEVTTNPHPEMMQEINQYRRRVVRLRRSMWPLRDVVSALQRSQLDFISSETDLFLRDVYDHTVRTVEIIESAREILASLTDLHVSALSFRMNEIMKVLAIIATFFLPLTFIAGLYGMNFDRNASPFNMPELEWYYGYPLVLGVMGLVAAGMFAFFRRRGWL